MGVSLGAGVIGVSGSGGTSLLSSPFMSLPIGIPKLVVSTVASGQTLPYIGTSDLVLLPSIVDVDNVNSVSRVVFSNVAAAFAGMVIGRIQSLSNSFKVVDNYVWVTTPCVDVVRDRLHREGHVSLVFPPFPL
ncbi:unnamed protein product [Trifolium pratense]|uniref:Uncharacterized protein n=1 Tax=Trifolium pratense TaxID=57577 RepID=A0ACB0ITM8_TRIPR|nr:unnamed protein product [Trifolium pratense]